MRGQMAEAFKESNVANDPDDLPQDGPMNPKRAGWAATALVAFAGATGSDLEDAVADLIADLGHFCDRHGLKMADEIARGREMYGYETQEEGGQFNER